MKKFYEKSKLWFAITWIIAYCVLMSLGDSLSDAVGIQKSVTVIIGVALSLILLIFLKKNKLFEEYGLCKSQTSAKSMLFYIPLLLMFAVNLCYGVTLNLGVTEALLYIISMLCVGFLEEIIFRGLLFNAMRTDSVKAAVIVSSVTFGIGHIINLINGSGAELVPNLLQVVYATSAGFMFVMIYLKTKSLLWCIAAHGIFNALSVFSNEANATGEMRIITAIFLTVITLGYGAYIAFSMKKSVKPKNHFE